VPSVQRARGHFGDVSVFWRLYRANDTLTPLEDGQEFHNASGSVAFTTGERTRPIVLQAVADKLPEFNEFYVLLLVNISGLEPRAFFPLFSESPNTPEPVTH